MQCIERNYWNYALFLKKIKHSFGFVMLYRLIFLSKKKYHYCRFFQVNFHYISRNLSISLTDFANMLDIYKATAVIPCSSSNSMLLCFAFSAADRIFIGFKCFAYLSNSLLIFNHL